MTVMVHASKRRRLSPPDEDMPTRIKKDNTAKQQQESAFFRNAGQWDLEVSYSKKARKEKKRDDKVQRLPIKTYEGTIQQVEAPLASDEEEDDLFEEGEDDTVGPELVEPVPEQPKISARQEILEAKEELARIAGLINEAPEENIGRLRRLAEVGQSKNITVKKLALATQLSIYKDIIPGYRIRPWTDSDTTGRLTKEVKALRNFEQGLVSSYQAYIKELANLARPNKGEDSEAARSLVSMAITCATSLLLAVPHFNFRGDIVKVLVDKLSFRKVDDDFSKCLRAIETLFADDEDGQPSQDVVTTLARMMKSREYNIHESVLNTFLHLRLLSDFSLKGSQNSIDRNNPDSQIPKKKRVFRTKKERKTAKEMKKVSEEMREADAVVSREERERIQAEILKSVFTCYFQVLKKRSAPLMGAVLEGLAKYAHLINQDFFGDILEVLRELCGQASEDGVVDEDKGEVTEEDEKPRRIRWDDPQRAVLLCTTTAFELLSGQDAAKAASGLSLDLSYFVSNLYKTLPALSLTPDLELSSKSLQVPDPRTVSGEPVKVNARATATLLVRALTAALMPRPTPQVRVAAFAHRLTNSALQTPEKSATALLGIMNQVAKIHGRKIAGLWDTEERRGDGNYDAWSNDLEIANPYAGNVWAGELLKLHYAPTVREGVMNLEKAIVAAQGKK